MSRAHPSWTLQGLADRLGRMDEAITDLRRRGDWRFDPPEQVPPLIFHWPGAVADHIDVRNGPGKLSRAGTIRRIEYVWDTAPATGVTVAWYLDGSGTATWTHNLGTSDEQTEVLSTAYTDQHIVAVVTAADATASGLTAWVYLD